MREAARDRVPAFLVKFLVPDVYRTLEYLSAVRCPVLIIHSREDAVVPVHPRRGAVCGISRPEGIRSDPRIPQPRVYRFGIVLRGRPGFLSFRIPGQEKAALTFDFSSRVSRTILTLLRSTNQVFRPPATRMIFRSTGSPCAIFNLVCTSVFDQKDKRPP